MLLLAWPLYLLLSSLYKLPVHHHPADQHEEEHQGGGHPLKSIINGKMWVEVEKLGQQEDDIGCFFHFSVGDNE